MPAFSYRRTLILGFGFLGISLLWGIYNAYVPLLLQAGRPDFTKGAGLPGYGLGTTITGFIMTLDNLAALLILPYIGALSDRTHTRLGRRRPYILAGAPVAAMAFAAIPLLNGAPLPVFMAAIIVTLLAMDLFRTPVIALMPDITPSAKRSQANGAINLMGGVGAVLAFLLGGWLFRFGIWAPFAFGAITMLVACGMVIAFIREPEQPAEAEGEASVLDTLRNVLRGADRSARALLLAIFFWFLGYAAIEVFWTSYATDVLGLNGGQATMLLTFFSLSIVICSIPSGLIGARLGRKRTITVGLLGFGSMLIWGYVLTDATLAPLMLVIAGAMWSLILVNSLPMVVDMAPPERLGSYTGLYYLASQSAAILGPVLVGWIIALAGNNYRVGFLYAPLTLLIALPLLLLVQRGEAVPAAPSLPEPAIAGER
ncbi:MFS transporter [Kallotenue papyrolyticum]|uniref:MFS transporter n=1 Tax=Kallotenue papyrolyticum TaxID=1325125 RepID=UPI0004786134|nr:MFS transporter [Kallotenue papyrolyticum]